MTTPAVLLFAGLPGALMVVIGVGHMGNYLKLKGTDPVDIRDLTVPSDEVELVGTARVHENTGRTPFTDTESLLYEWKVKEYRPSPGSSASSASSGSNWSLLDSGDQAHPFVLEDETGTVLVDTNGASPYLQTSTVIEVEGDESPPLPVAQFLQSTDEVDREHDRTRRYHELRLDPGGDVHVLGPVRESGPQAVDAVIGVDNPDRAIVVGEDSLSTIIDKLKSENSQFIVTNADEHGTKQQMLQIGALFFGMGLFFLGIAGLVVV